MSWYRFIVILILVFFFGTPIHYHQTLYQFLNTQEISQISENKISILNNPEPDKWEILLLKNGAWEKQELVLPYIAYSSAGLISNYDNFSDNVNIFLDGNMLSPIKQKSLFPKIAFPFFIMQSSDRSYLEIYKIIGGSLRFLTQVYTQNIITSYSSSPNGQYLIIGTLSNELLVLDAASPIESKVSSIELTFPKPATYAVGITDQGLYYTLGSFEPSLLMYGTIDTPKTNSIELPFKIEPKTQNLLTTGNFIVMNGFHQLSMMEIDGDDISQKEFSTYRPYSLCENLFLGNSKMAFLYAVTSSEYLLDVIDIDSGHLLYKTHFFTTSIPKFFSYANKHYLLLKEGGILL